MEATTAKILANGACPSHAFQLEQFLRQKGFIPMNDDGSSVQNTSSTALPPLATTRERVDRLNFRDPFSIQIEEGSEDDWYRPAYVDIDYHDGEGGQVRSMDFRNCSFSSIPESVWALPRLVRLEIHAMEYLTSIVESSSKHVLQNSNLKELVISECCALERIPSLPKSLDSIRLKGCHCIEFMPPSILNATSLTKLQISNMMFPIAPSLPPNLEELQIIGSETRIRNLARILCEGSKDLKSMRLSMCNLNDGHLKGIWHFVLPICPNLRKLNLSGNNIQSLASLTDVETSSTATGQQQQRQQVHPKKAPRTVRTRLRILNLEANPIVNSEDSKEADRLLEILEQNPELWSLGDTNFELSLFGGTAQSNNSVQRALDRNFSQVLKNEEPASAPLALWSHVLASATTTNGGRMARRKSEAERASLVYSVLQGPVFVERLPHSYTPAAISQHVPNNLRR